MNAGTFELGSLSDPGSFTEKLDLGEFSLQRLSAYLRMMLLIRSVEERIGDGIVSGHIVCPCHLGIGQEAVAVGISENLRATDRVFGAHRSHSHYLALGGETYGLLAEVLGKEDGCSKGMGGSMHLYGAKHGFMGSVPIVAGTVPLAVGAGLAAKKDAAGDVAVAYFGDGAAEEGVVHESLNLAAILKLPVLFVCENNLFSSHLHISLRQPANRVGRYGEMHRIPTETIDGNDVTAVALASAHMIERMRSGGGPGFIEAVTYRWRGHVGPREDNDVGVDRDADLVKWKARDPIRRLFDAMEVAGMLDAASYARMQAAVVEQVEVAWARALKAGFPPASSLMDFVYAEKADRGAP